MKKDDIKKVSRRDFLKGTAAGAIGLATMGTLGLTACSSNEASDSTAEASSAVSTKETTESATFAEVPVSTSAEVTPEADSAVQSDGDWLGSEPAIGESQIIETVDVDVVVVGAGLAGVCAARSAAEEGAAVALIEKSEQANCRSGQYALLGGQLNDYFGRPAIDPNLVVDRFMRECTYRIKRPIIWRWANEAHEAFDWFIEAMPDLYIAKTSRDEIPDESKDFFLEPMSWPLPELYDYTTEEFPVFPYSMNFSPGHEPIFKANLEKSVNEFDVQVYYGHFGEKLETENGRITGILVRDSENGSYLRFNAKNGVILTTGDNGGNQDIMAHFTPSILKYDIPSMPMGTDVEGNPINTGDGIKMGSWIGARVQENHAPMTHCMGVMGAMGTTPFLLLNKHGKRFMNESAPGQQLQNQIELQPGQYVHQIYDDGWREQLQYMPPNHGAVSYYDNYVPKNHDSGEYMSDEKFEQAIENGQILAGDTLEDLLDQLDIDKEAALASIERYNKLAKDGNDDDFNKPAQRMFAIEKGPFYASSFGLAPMLVNCGGLESDEECHVYDMDGKVMPGLYVAGNVQGSRYAVEYPICMRGISHSMCVFYGYIAGKNVVTGV